MLSFAEMAATVAVVVQIVKTFLELWLKPDYPLHDNTIRALSLLLGVGIVLLNQFFPAEMQLVYNGGLIGVAAWGGYHASKQLLAKP